MRLMCKRKTLSDMKELKFIDTYSNMINPLDYEFDVDTSRYYLILGIQIRKGTPWLYIISGSDQDPEVQVIPALLFDFIWSYIPADWKGRINEKSQEIEILPESLTTIEHWFEKYIEEEEETLKIVNDEINRIKLVYDDLMPPKEPEDPYAWPFEEYK